MKTPVLNILTYVLEDDELVLMMIKKALENQGIINYKLFHRSKELLDESTMPHIAVIDYLLKDEEKNGLEVTKEILKRNPNCYVIIMSAQDSWDVLKNFMNSGARYYVEKKGNYLAEVAEQVNEASKKLKMDLDFFTMLVEKFNERDKCEKK